VADAEAQLERQLPEAVGTPCVGISALTGAGVERLLPAAAAAYGVWAQRVPTARLNRWLLQARPRAPPPARAGPPAAPRAEPNPTLPYTRAWPCRRAPTAAAAQVLEEYRGTAQGRQAARIRYVTQVGARPPTFAAFASGAKPFSEGIT